MPLSPVSERKSKSPSSSTVPQLVSPHSNKREAERFKLCFNEVNKLRQEGDRLLVMIHYPPFAPKLPETDFTRLFEENKAEKVVFGHIHGETYFPFRTVKNNIEYILTSCDKVGFSPASSNEERVLVLFS